MSNQMDIDELIDYSKTLKLLYVEDNKDARESTLTVLEEFFDDITVAVDGQDGYDKFISNDIDMIITDINMPKLTGLEMTKKIREKDIQVPILVLSAYNETSFFISSIEIGVDGYLLKPIDIEQFLVVLQKVIQNLKLIKESSNHLHFLKEYEKITNEGSIVSKTNPKGIITYVNDKFCKLSGYSEDELVGKSHNIIRHPDMDSKVFEEIWHTIKIKKQSWNGIVKNLAKNGKSYYVQALIKPILDSDGNIVEYIALRNDITDIMNPYKQLIDNISNKQKPIVVYMQLDDYGTLEELYDNRTIEKIQDSVTKILEKSIIKLCPFDKVYQLGNGEYAIADEFTNCITHDNIDEFIKKLKQFQDEVKDSVVQFDDVHYDLSILVSLVYDGTQVIESAKLGIRQLLHTKQSFIISNNLAIKENQKAQKNMKTLSMVKKALNELRIVSHFQPIINNKTQEIEKYESLVRLIDEDGRILSPFFFLDIAKKGRYYAQITNIVLDNSFAALKYTNMDISVNLSALDIEFKSTREKIFELLEANKSDAPRVVVELLEDESIKDFDILKEFIYNIKKYGVKIAIDDFGAGYSNFERLLDYQPDILKIDGSLIRDIETNSYSYSVVKTIVTFAKEQKIKTVAEFVENENIFNILKDLGVDYSQGYYFGKPEELQK